MTAAHYLSYPHVMESFRDNTIKTSRLRQLPNSVLHMQVHGFFRGHDATMALSRPST